MIVSPPWVATRANTDPFGAPGEVSCATISISRLLCLDVADSFPVFALRLRHRDALRHPCLGRRPGSVGCGQR
jgi:hypothetical protein